MIKKMITGIAIVGLMLIACIDDFTYGMDIPEQYRGFDDLDWSENIRVQEEQNACHTDLECAEAFGETPPEMEDEK